MLVEKGSCLHRGGKGKRGEAGGSEHQRGGKVAVCVRGRPPASRKIKLRLRANCIRE